MMRSLRTIISDVRASIPCDEVTLYRVAGAEFAPIAYEGILSESRVLGSGFPLTFLGEWDSAPQARKPIIIHDVAGLGPEERAFRRAVVGWQATESRHSPRSWMGVRVLADDCLVGLLGFAHHLPGYFTADQAQRVQARTDASAASIENAILHAETARLAEETRTLLAVQQTITSRLELNAVLQLIAEEARRLVQARRAMVFLVEGDSLQLKVMAGEPSDLIRPGYRMSLSQSLTGLAMRVGHPYRGLEPADDSRTDNHISVQLGTLSYVVVPLLLEDRKVGAIVATDRLVGVFGPGDERMLSLLAPGAVIALENARLYRQADRLARLQERQELAMSLHDTTAQMLFGVELIAKQLLENPSLQCTGETRNRLETMLGLAERGGQELRSAISALRHETAREPSGQFHTLHDLFHNEVEDFRRRTGINTALVITPHASVLSSEASAVIYRVLREALANVTKHAAASTVLVSLTFTDDTVTLTVQDDGVGVDQALLEEAAMSPRHFGIATMREALAHMHGVLDIVNGDDGGAVVRMSLPLSGQT